MVIYKQTVMKLPNSMVPVKVQGLSLHALFDSCAIVNAISSQLLERYPKLRKYKSPEKVVN